MRTGIDVLERVGLAVPSARVIWMRASPTALADGVEAHLGRAAPRLRRRCVGLAVDRQDRRIERLDRDRGLAALLQLAVHDRAEERLVADGEEARERRRQHQRLVDADLALRPSRSATALSPATAMMRYVVSDSGSVTSRLRAALRVGDDRAEPEREHAEVLAQRARSGVLAAAAAVRRALRRQHAAADDLCRESSFDDLQRLLEIDRVEHVGRLVGGQRQHAVVDGPQRDLDCDGLPLASVDVHFDLRLRRRTELVAVRLHVDVQPLRRVLDLQLDVAEAEGRLARIAPVLAGVLLRAALDSSTETKTFGMSFSVIGTVIVCCVDVSVERLPGADAFALGGEQRRGVSPTAT